MAMKSFKQVSSLLKRYRKVPATACLPLRGGLTTREDWLYDRILRVVEEAEEDLAKSIYELASAPELSLKSRINAIRIMTRDIQVGRTTRQSSGLQNR
jgi:hypothetical protein